MMKVPKLDELTFEEERHIYQLDGRILPSVTTIMRPLSNAMYGTVDESILKKAAFLDAEIADSASRMATVSMQAPTARGVSMSKDWEIIDIDLSKVPDTVMGVLIRPVDTAAVMKIIRASKGAIKIVFYFSKTWKLV